MNTDPQATLHYIDKVHATLLETGKAVNRQALFTVVLSLLLIALASGLVAAEQKFSLSGLNVQFPSWLLSFIGVWILLLVYVNLLGLLNHEDRLRDTILRLYKNVGFSDESMTDLEANPIEYPSILTVSLSDANMRLGRASLPISVVVALSMFALPLGSAGFAGYSLVVTQGISWWLISSLSLAGLIAITYTIAFLRSLSS